ncbi:MAG: CTP synthase, partial [Spirochaeta sp.]
SFPFIEAARQMIHELGHKNVISVHVTLVPVLPGDELKTKPTQHSVKEMRAIGIQPDILLCRAPHLLDEDMRRKIALFTNVDYEAVVSAYDVPTIYQVPLAFHDQGADQLIVDRLELACGEAEVAPWRELVHTLTSARKKLRIAVVGKYIDLQDSYKSVDEALYHGGVANAAQVELVKMDSEALEKEADLGSVFNGISGILVPGGFGGRGILGMIQTAEFARIHNIPYFGICLGMQIMVIEYSRNVMGYADADSSEFAPDCRNLVISLLEDQVDIQNYGGTMRLGSNQSRLIEGSLIHKAYGTDVISERHRHRYEVNNRYRDQLVEAGLQVSGTTMDSKLVESVQWPDHPWGVGVQFHPEFKSQPTKPHPLFAGFIAAALQNKPYRHTPEQSTETGSVE